MRIFVFLLSLATVIDCHGFELAEKEWMVDGVVFTVAEDAAKNIKEGSKVYLGPGVFSEGININHNNVLISGSDNTHFIGAVVNGKATFVVNGDDVTIENIECSGVAVRDNNGACVRQQGKNLTLSNVYFHDSQQGVLSGKDTGRLLVQFSRMERLGLKGRAHGIYSANDELIIRHSTIINAKDQGHEVKSRAKKTVISNSVIGSVDSNNSRAVDIPNGGELSVSNSVVFQGTNTVNRQLFGYGLETMARARQHTIRLDNNIFILERTGANEFLALPAHADQAIDVTVFENAIIGQNIIDMEQYKQFNTVYETRIEAGMSADIPDISTLPALRLLKDL
ncbi:hypothetical protein [Alteromonas gilva]|uniref:Right handed beta helix domain-containing protein n=1 Tax=Alteromonas gilva TaxID=2987522 RepID=A0ABT5L3H6_9ALTE|nr:hypothetical protein [Alteromonas gilva]MDC8830333.1 hypothetical protein [Alteromonas gilva]